MDRKDKEITNRKQRTPTSLCPRFAGVQLRHCRYKERLKRNQQTYPIRHQGEAIIRYVFQRVVLLLAVGMATKCQQKAIGFIGADFTAQEVVQEVAQYTQWAQSHQSQS